MSPDRLPHQPSGLPRATTAVVAAYGLLAVAGLVGTWYFNLQFSGEGGQSYVSAWFANPASSSAAVDVIVAAVAACLFFVWEGRRLGWRWAVALVPLTFLVALAFTFPLFLAAREVALARAARVTRSAANDSPRRPASGGAHP